MKKCLLLLVTMLTVLCLRGQQTFTYLERDTLSLKLDVYQPANPRPDKACVIYVFGGGFYSGERNSEHSMQCCRMLADRGFVAIAIDYRLYLRHAPKVSVFKMHALFDTAIRYAVEDCSAAISWVCDHAQTLGIDTSRIVLTGSSAGAITVLQTDYSRCNSLPPTDALPRTFVPAAVVPYAGGIYCHNNGLKYNVPPAPTCFFHGTTDRIVNYNSFRGSFHKALYGANKVARAFTEQGYGHWILRFEDRGHEIASVLPQTIDEFCAFVNAALAGRVMHYDATCYDSDIRQSKWSTMHLLDLYKLR